MAIRKEFIPKYVEWFNDPEVLKHLIMYRPMTIESEERWYAHAVENQNEIYFAIMKIETKENQDRLIGNCSIRLNFKDRVGNVGIAIGEKECWGMGYGTEALKLLIGYGFQELNMQRIELEVHSNNPRAQRCYEKVGFQKEGVRRRAFWKNNEYIDSIFMSILKEEWNVQHTQNT